jgi:hypothetical protein
MSHDIKNIRDACLVCCRNAPSQAATPAIAPHIPSTPFESIVADYFESHGHHFLVVADRLSGWVEIFSSPAKSFMSSAAGLTAHLRNFFRMFGVPEQLASDGGPQFKALVTEEFLAKWGVQHRVSSAYFPQSNGRAEVAVKTAKRLLLDNIAPSGSLNNDKFLRAILQLRNTPDPDCNVSPAEIVFGHQLRDAFKFVNTTEKFKNQHIRPMWRDAWRSKESALRTRFTRTAEHLNTKARDLVPLSSGERVFVQNQNGNHPTKWDRSGIIMESQGNDQYLVKIDGSGRLTLRNRRFLRKYTTASPTITYPKSSAPLSDGPASDLESDSGVDQYMQKDPAIIKKIPQRELSLEPLPVDMLEPTTTPEHRPNVNTEHDVPQSSPVAPVQQPEVAWESNHRPRRERKPRKLYDAHTGSWI